MGQIWKTAERFYELIQSKEFFYKVLLQIWLQACRVSSQYSLYTSTKNKRQILSSKNQATAKSFLMRNRNMRTH